MLVKILGGIDLIMGLVLIFSSTFSGSKFLVFLAMILIVKALMGFFQEVGGWIDIAGGVFLLLASIGIVITLINVIVGFLVLQKGVISFL